MEQEFIPHEQALALKELGFDEPCFGYYGENQELIWKSGYAPWVNSERNLVDNHFVTTPLYQQAFRWFREKYNFKSWVEEHTADTFIYEIRPHILTHYKEGEVYVYTIYEEAELACLIKLIEIVKNK
jgi:hypothetical protein